ncbi:TPA: hypothetical protein NKU35_003433 [Vibrio parahaemolyticus]|nr:hypothetical protein [Vibrio parahaemolyticus]HCH5494729.1 hypothetical protein [Vibrio parahaemolyticus]HCH6275964.1 hypothetical protein [Vibrio parahaemolyticus]HCH6312411.1 hypothetical protein [Vibrio parahaemolyticus]HCH6482997.1 hypothetical protein [Vibrio parahaemolyticus]
MVTTTLQVQHGEVLERDEPQNIDVFIDDLIAKHSKNAEMMNLMALEATALATSVESRSRGLESQGFLKRAWKSFTGSNQKVAARNSRDLAQGQYLGQQMLNKLAENNLMTYQMVVALGDKVNRVAQELNTTREGLVQVNQTLATFFTDVRQKLESKFTSLERNDDLLFWKSTIKYEPVYQGKEYAKLNRAEKVVCLANDFFRYSQQQWNPRDLSFLKSVIEDVGEHPHDKMVLREIYESYSKDESLLTQLFRGIEEEPDLSSSTDLTPTLMTFEKLQALESHESPIIDTILKYAPEVARNTVALDLAEEFAMNESGRSLSREITVFDAVMNLVEDLSLHQQFARLKSQSVLKETTLVSGSQSISLDESSLILSDVQPNEAVVKAKECNPDELETWLTETVGNDPYHLKKLKRIEIEGLYSTTEKISILPKDNRYILIDILPRRSLLFIHSLGQMTLKSKGDSLYGPDLDLFDVMSKIHEPLFLKSLEVQSKVKPQTNNRMDKIFIDIIDVDDSLKDGEKFELELNPTQSSLISSVTVSVRGIEYLSKIGSSNSYRNICGRFL